MAIAAGNDRSLDLQDFKVDIVALLNDTTGALMACAHSSPNCFMGLILGNLEMV